MTKEFLEEVRLTTGASIPCLAISSSAYDEVIRLITEYAWSEMTWLEPSVPPQVLVWRQSIGFEEYAMHVPDEDGNLEVLNRPLDLGNQHSAVLRKTGTTYTPDGGTDVGEAVPFAVDYMIDYDCDVQSRKALFILRDWHRYVNSNAHHVDKQARLFEESLLGNMKSVFALCPTRWNSSDNTTIPIELIHYTRRTKIELPNKDERLSMVRNAALTYGETDDFKHGIAKIDESGIETISDALGGMTRMKINDVLAMSLIKHGTFHIPFVLEEKRKAIKEAGFTLMHPDSGFERIGGLTPLKEWIRLIAPRFTKAARDYGFTRNLRGLLMAGVPGCGKSAVAKASANEMNMNIMMVQATDLKGSLVGESEGKVQRLLDIARAAAPLIVFVDEAEKLLGKSEGIHDGGAHDAVLGQFLTFMQEDDSGVFFVFTANNMSKFAPELVDRFEGRFFIDLPKPTERKDIIEIHLDLRQYGQQDSEHFDVDELVRLTDSFSGRNIEDAIEEAMTISFSENCRPLEQADLRKVFETVVPTSETKADEIDGMRKYVEDGLMREANDQEEAAARATVAEGPKSRINF